jgi:hypothetical protein
VIDGEALFLDEPHTMEISMEEMKKRDDVRRRSRRRGGGGGGRKRWKRPEEMKKNGFTL